MARLPFLSHPLTGDIAFLGGWSGPPLLLQGRAPVPWPAPLPAGTLRGVPVAGPPDASHAAGGPASPDRPAWPRSFGSPAACNVRNPKLLNCPSQGGSLRDGEGFFKFKQSVPKFSYLPEVFIPFFLQIFREVKKWMGLLLKSLEERMAACSCEIEIAQGHE